MRTPMTRMKKKQASSCQGSVLWPCPDLSCPRAFLCFLVWLHRLTCESSQVKPVLHCMSMACGLLELVIWSVWKGLWAFLLADLLLLLLPLFHFVVTSQISSVYTIGREKYRMVVCGVCLCTKWWCCKLIYTFHTQVIIYWRSKNKRFKLLKSFALFFSFFPFQSARSTVQTIPFFSR